MLLGSYDLWLLVVGIGVLIAATLPRLVTRRPISMPILLLALGFAVGMVPWALPTQTLFEAGLVERVTELGVIVALMGAGLRVHRRPGLHRWGATWRLLAITMVVTIGATALLGWQLAALAPASAVLLGAVMAPTDPVLASEVQVAPPGQVPYDEPFEPSEAAKQEDDEVRFALTSEAGLNDGLAFPFTHLAVALALTAGGFGAVAGDWLLVDVFYRIGVALAIGIAAGFGLARLVRQVPQKTHHNTAVVGLFAIAATLILYSLTQLVGGYGFIAVFVGAIVIHHGVRGHGYHFVMAVSAEQIERLLTAAVLIGVGIAIARGVLLALNWPLVVLGAIIVLVVRPLAGAGALAGHPRSSWPERWFIGFFGIRGIGSLYYLSYAVRRAEFPGENALWAVVVLVVALSVLLHGALASPLLERLEAGAPERQP